MKMNNGYFEIGGEKVAIGIPVLEIEHTDLSIIEESMVGLGMPNFLIPAFKQELTTVDLPFENDGTYRIVDTNGLAPFIGYIFVQSVNLSGNEMKALYMFGMEMGVVVG
jgi:hypothetical protein